MAVTALTAYTADLVLFHGQLPHVIVICVFAKDVLDEDRLLLANAMGAVLSLGPYSAKQRCGYEVRITGGEEQTAFVRALLHCAGVPGKLGKNSTLCRSQGQASSCSCHAQ